MHKRLVVVDGGDAFSTNKDVPQIRAETAVEGMNLIRYDAHAIGEGELSLGVDSLKRLQEKASFPMVSANVYLNDEPLAREYVIRDVDGLKVGITSVCGPDLLRPAQGLEGLNIQEPHEALERVMKHVRSRSDVVVLLSHLEEEVTRGLVSRFPGIDVAVVGHGFGAKMEVGSVGKTILVKDNLKGESVGVLELMVDKRQGVRVVDHKLFRLTSEAIQPDEEGLKILASFSEKKAAVEDAQCVKTQQARELQKAREMLNLAPEEFLEKMRQEKKLLVPEAPGRRLSPGVE